MITTYRKNNMGTVSFVAKFKGMKKAEEFIVYPIQDCGDTIKIQSDHRFGNVDITSGQSVLSARRNQYANSVWLSVCVAAKKAIAFTLCEEDRQTLANWVKSTGGVTVGGAVKSDNTGALFLKTKGATQ